MTNYYINEKGVYFARKILDYLNIMIDVACEKKILKTSDLGANTNLAAISSSVSTDFVPTNLASVVIKEYSEYIKKDFYNMGEENLNILPEAGKYYEDLKKVYESDSVNRAFEYYKLFYRYQYSVSNCLKEALLKAERKVGVPVKITGASYFFETSLNNVIVLSNDREDYTKMGLKVPGSEGKFIQIDGNDILRGKVKGSSANANPSSVNTCFVINIPYNEEKEIPKKIYPVVSTYKNKPIEIVEMVSASELIEILKNDYNATYSNVVVDVESLFKASNDVRKKCLQDGDYFVNSNNSSAGSKNVNTVLMVRECQMRREFPPLILKGAINPVALSAKQVYSILNKKKFQNNTQDVRKVA